MKQSNLTEVVDSLTRQTLNLIQTASTQQIHQLCICESIRATIDIQSGQACVAFAFGSRDLPDHADIQSLKFAFYLPVGGHPLFVDGSQGDVKAIIKWLGTKSLPRIEVERLASRSDNLEFSEFVELIETAMFQSPGVVEAIRAELLAALRSPYSQSLLLQDVEDYLQQHVAN